MRGEVYCILTARPHPFLLQAGFWTDVKTTWTVFPLTRIFLLHGRSNLFYSVIMKLINSWPWNSEGPHSRSSGWRPGDATHGVLREPVYRSPCRSETTEMQGVDIMPWSGNQSIYLRVVQKPLKCKGEISHALGINLHVDLRFVQKSLKCKGEILQVDPGMSMHRSLFRSILKCNI